MRIHASEGANTCFQNNSSKVFSCIRASANTGPTCICAKINSSRIISCMYWFCAGGYVPRQTPNLTSNQGVRVRFMFKSRFGFIQVTGRGGEVWVWVWGWGDFVGGWWSGLVWIRVRGGGGGVRKVMGRSSLRFRLGLQGWVSQRDLPSKQTGLEGGLLFQMFFHKQSSLLANWTGWAQGLADEAKVYSRGDSSFRCSFINGLPF